MIRTTCLVAGGGPAGLMLGLLLARGGIGVTVLEKHADFLRDFRGDTVHPSTIRLLDELGLGHAFRKLPQTQLGALTLPATNGGRIALGNFSGLPAPYNYVAMLPQWEFLNFLAAEALTEPTFTLRVNTEVTGLAREGDRVTGVTTRTRDGVEDVVIADLVIACDGRGSTLRQAAGLVPKDFPVPFDTWWFRLPRHPGEGGPLSTVLPEFKGKDILLAITREDYYQIAFFAPKGSDKAIRAAGIEAFRARIATLRPDFAERVDALKSMDDIYVLDVKLNRLQRWHQPGLLLIGDAAHAMSPAGGVGVNLAIQDAAAAATLLRDPLRDGSLTEAHLARVQRRRWLPTVVIQWMQRILHEAVFSAAFTGKRAGPPPFVLWLVEHVPGLNTLPARLVGFGPRPEHAPVFARRPAKEPT
jgi:2-polyprenyl-6-methoxyphenol hydroxylase-like FAD-dependent oxidoreductase